MDMDMARKPAANRAELFKRSSFLQICTRAETSQPTIYIKYESLERTGYRRVCELLDASTRRHRLLHAVDSKNVTEKHLTVLASHSPRCTQELLFCAFVGV